MLKGSKLKNRFQKLNNLLVIFLILATIIFNDFDILGTLFSPNRLYPNHKQLLEEEKFQMIHKNVPNIKINNLTEEPIQYWVEQGVKFELKTSELKLILTTSETNVSIQSKVINSSFQILSSGNNSAEWKNETGYGDVNVSTILVDNENVFRLNFSNKSIFDPYDSGVNNTKFQVSPNPSPVSFPTFISFDFRIPFPIQELINTTHTLSLDFGFNNGTIKFILSDYNGTYTYRGEKFRELEENVIYDDISCSIYILCNETAPFSWRHISQNITRLISHLSPLEYPNFSSLQTLFCHISFYNHTQYKLTLDINDLEYFTFLSPCPPINYIIGETMVFADNGSLSFDSIMENFTLIAQDESAWKNNSQTYIEVNISRTKNFESFVLLKDWNDTKIRVNLFLDIPSILESASFSIIHVLLPFDWINITLPNQSVVFMFYNKTKMLNEFILGKFYQANVYGIEWSILEAWTPNYFSNIKVTSDVRRNEVFELRGNIRYPLTGDINLYLQNGSFLFHQTTIPMINSTFIFPDIMITEQFPLGILQLTLNWSNSWEFGMYEQLIYVYEQGGINSVILFQSSQELDIYQFETFLINLSLLQNGEEYCTNSTMVFLIRGGDCLFFSHISSNNFILNVSHVIWDPGFYIIDIIASDGSLFFAKDTLNLTIRAASIFWSFENLQNILSENESINFRLYSYIKPQDADYYKILSGLTIRIWINATIISYFQTNPEGFVDIFFDYQYPTLDDYLQVAIEGMFEGEVVKLQTLLFLISNETSSSGGDRAYIHEIMRSPVKANETYYVYYQIEYPSNNSNWFVPVESFRNVLLSAYILRDSYIIGTKIEDYLLSWTLKANQSNHDIMVLELPGPTLLVEKESVLEKFRFKLEIFSKITISNFSIEINLVFLGFSFSNISLFDSLSRNITDLYPITIKGAIIYLFQFNIIGGFEICYFLEGYLQEMDIVIRKPFKSSYIYNESIVGSWRINTPIGHAYFVLYSILGLGTWECYNTSVEVLPNLTSVITAVLPPQSWNTTVSIQLVVKYFSDLIIASSFQNFIIYDPFPPTLDYSVELLGSMIKIHAFVYEPEKASGIKNVSLLIGDQSIKSTFLSLNHYCFDISTKTVDFPVIKVIDWAGNEISTEFIDINDFFSNPPSLLELIESQYFFPILFSITMICGILVLRIIKKKRTTIF
ncbi:MAG: hypothetical protein ACFFAE_01715 [Candidatus Hodarchaeota archaeon]